MAYLAIQLRRNDKANEQGITLSALWTRLTLRKPEFPLKLDEKCQEFLWANVVAVAEGLFFYELDEPRPELTVFDRSKYVDPNFLIISEQKEVPVDIYPYVPVNDKERGIVGSCASYYTRQEISSEIRDVNSRVLDLHAVQKRWGEKLVVVASQRQRCSALLGYNQVDFVCLSDKEYFCLERIGRSRFHGEITLGTRSLKVMNIPPKTLFYVRKRLRCYQLITVQPFMHRTVTGMNMNCKLIHLARFFVEQRPKWSICLEKLTTHLAERPNQRAISSELREAVGLSSSMFKSILSYGSKHLKTDLIPYLEYYPDRKPLAASRAKYGKSSSERKLRVVKLVKPYVYKIQRASYEVDVGADEDEEDIDEDSDDGSECDATAVGESSKLDSVARKKLMGKQVIVERPLLRQIYDEIQESGSRGLTCGEISVIFRITKLDARCLTRNLERKNCVASIFFDEGRKCSKRFMALQYITDSNQNAVIKKKIKVKQSTSTHKATSVKSALTGRQSKKDDIVKKADEAPERITLQKLKRQQVIVDLVESAKVIYLLKTIEQRIAEEEKTAWRADRKTILRLVKQLSDRNLLKIITKNIKLPDGSERKKDFICANDITEESSQFVLALQYVVQSLMKPDKPQFSVDPNLNKNANTCAVSPKKSKGLKYDMDGGKRYGYQPRCARMKTFHQFVWSLVYGSDSSVSAEEVKISNESEPDTIDSDVIPMWYNVISKLPKLGYPTGWYSIGDIIDNMPLSVFCQVVCIPFIIPNVSEYLMDPVKCDTLFKSLPKETQQGLKLNRRHITCIDELCHRLAELGILSIGKGEYRKKEQIFVFVHRKAMFAETSHAPVTETTVYRHFTFDTLTSVQQYWRELMIECLNTPLENISICTSNENRIYYKKIFRQDGCHSGKNFGETIDIPRIPGDGRGAAGFDSILFLHLKRNWVMPSQLSTIQLYSVLRHENHPLLKPVRTHKKRQPKVVPVEIQPKEEENGTSTSPRALDGSTATAFEGTDAVDKVDKKLLVVKIVKPNKGGRGVKRKSRAKEVEPEAKKGKLMKLPKSRAIAADIETKDVEAKKKMTNLRVSWSTAEDSLLLLSEVTSQFMIGPSRSCAVRPYVVRDILHEHILISRDKSSKAVNRRIGYMMKSPATAQNVSLFLSEALMDKELVNEFRTSKKYVFTAEKENAVAFKKCFEKLRNKFSTSNESKDQLRLPDTLADLERQFIIHRPTVKESRTHKDPKDVENIQYFVMQNFIHAALATCDKIGRVHELYQVCRSYPSTVVNNAFDGLMCDRIVTKIKKSDAKARQTAATFGSIGCYKLSQKYYYIWNSYYPSSMYDLAYDAMERLLKLPDENRATEDGDWATLDESVGSSILTVSLMAQRKIEFKLKVPENIVILDSLFTSKDFDDLQKPKPLSRGAAEGDEDSDAEEERMIEEAETNRVGKKGNSPDPSASRSVLWLYKCQYIHSIKQSAKFSNISDNIFVKSCDVKVRLASTAVRQPSEHSRLSVNDHSVGMFGSICRWNRCQLVLHPRTAGVMLKSIRRLVPEHLSVIDSCEDAAVPSVSCDQGHPQSAIHHVYNLIKGCGYLGITFYELKMGCVCIESDTLSLCLALLCDVQVVLRVGVTVFRYVALCHAQYWLVTIDKNVRGRGSTPIGIETNSTINLKSVWEANDQTDQGLGKTCIMEVFDNAVWKSSILSFEFPVPCHDSSAQKAFGASPQGVPLGKRQQTSKSSPAAKRVKGGNMSKKKGAEKNTRSENTAMESSKQLEHEAQAKGKMTEEGSEQVRNQVEIRVVAGDGVLPDSVSVPSSLLITEEGSEQVRSQVETRVVASDSVSVPSSSLNVHDVNNSIGNIHADIVSIGSSLPNSMSSSVLTFINQSTLSSAVPQCTSIRIHQLAASSAVAISSPVSIIRSQVVSLPISSHQSHVVPRHVSGGRLHAVSLPDSSRPSLTRSIPSFTPVPSAIPSNNYIIGDQRQLFIPHPPVSAVPARQMLLRVGALPPPNSTISHPLPVPPGSGPIGGLPFQMQTASSVPTLFVQAPVRLAFAQSGGYVIPSGLSTNRLPPVFTPVCLAVGQRPLMSGILPPSSVACRFFPTPVRTLTAAVPSLAAVSNDDKFPLRSPPAITRVLPQDLPSNTDISPVSLAALRSTCVQYNVPVVSQGVVPTQQLAFRACETSVSSSMARSCYPRSPSVRQIVSQSTTVRNIQHKVISPGSSISVPSHVNRLAIPSCTNVCAPTGGGPIRIRFDASKLGVTGDSGVLAARIQDLLSQSGSIRPGASIRIRFMSTQSQSITAASNPLLSQCTSGLSSLPRYPSSAQDLPVKAEPPPSNSESCVPPRASSCTTSSSVFADTESLKRVPIQVQPCKRELHTVIGSSKVEADHPSPAATVDSEANIPQLDGTNDEEVASSCQETKSGVVSGAVQGSSNCEQLAESESLSPSKSVRIQSRKVGERCGDPVDLLARTSTYRTVRVVARPWRSPEGTVNHTSMKTMLKGVMSYIMENPGVTNTSLCAKYSAALQPVCLFELVEMLEQIGCVYQRYIRIEKKASLFSSRTKVSLVTDDVVDDDVRVFFPTVDCVLKLGQFLAQL